MTAPDAVDLSFSRPSSWLALRAAGIRVVCRYLSPPPNGKNLTKDEAVAIHAAGIGILLNWEWYANRAREGADAGRADGAMARQQMAELNAPMDGSIAVAFSVDFDTTPADYPQIDRYFAGVDDGLAGAAQVAAYAEADALDHLHGEGLVTAEWQTYAWSRGRLSEYADLYQYLNGQALAGATVDFNRLIHPELLGVWWPPGQNAYGPILPPAPPRPKSTLENGDDMPNMVLYIVQEKADDPASKGVWCHYPNTGQYVHVDGATPGFDNAGALLAASGPTLANNDKGDGLITTPPRMYGPISPAMHAELLAGRPAGSGAPVETVVAPVVGP